MSLSVSGPDLLRAPNLDVPHGFTLRSGGVSAGPFASLNLGLSSGDDAERVERNRDRVLASLGVRRDQVFAFNQVHGTRIVEQTPSWFTEDADAAITDHPDHLLVISVADCLPLLFHDPVRQVIGAAHCGWRGTVAGLAGKLVRRLQDGYDVDPDTLQVAIGPGIRGACYQVGAEVGAQFREAGFPDTIATPDDEGRFRLDLVAANRWRLEQAGVPADNIADVGRCTHCEPDAFYSYRRDAGTTGRHWALIRLGA
ncbi:MAG: peptidoglycan editing factor PgeF [Trueperaceae bacterium]|nr:peptidoglycan editing factor PgeF [Trueperaceae bacterium]